MSASRLDQSFYLQSDVVAVAQTLLGKKLCSTKGDDFTAGIIVETEAYQAPEDKASHAYGGRRTQRTEIMYASGGHSYVYLIYGIHHLFNVVTGPVDTPHAVLIRALQPTNGLDRMRERRKVESDRKLSSGPGTLSVALGINREDSGLELWSQASEIWIEDMGLHLTKSDILASPRVGVDYAEECAKWPYRFRWKDNPYTSQAR